MGYKQFSNLGTESEIAAMVVDMFKDSGIKHFRIYAGQKEAWIKRPKWYQFWLKPTIEYSFSYKTNIDIFTELPISEFTQEIAALQKMMPVCTQLEVKAVSLKDFGLYWNGKRINH